ncbi:MAG: PilW family protein [Gemmatimonadales bacterium]
MRALSRKGFTLVEMLVALVLLGIVMAGVYRVLVSNQRMYHAQIQRIDLQQNIRAAASILPAEFQELNANDGDIYAMSATTIDLRAMRQLGFICSAPVLPTAAGLATFMVRQNLFFGGRDFDADRDSLLLYYEGDETSRADDGWVVADPTLITNGVCPTPGGGAAWQVTARLIFAAGQVDAGGTQRIPVGSPVRGFVPVRYELYQSGTRWYIGYDELSDAGSVQPLIGPVSTNGLTLAYYDSTGVVTTDRTLVQLIEIRLRAETAQPVHSRAGGLITPVDSIATRVALRNNRRW